MWINGSEAYKIDSSDHTLAYVYWPYYDLDHSDVTKIPHFLYI